MAQYTESFNQADSTTLGPDLTWTEILGDAWRTVTNEAAVLTSTGNNIARAEADSTGSRQFCEAALTNFVFSSSGGATVTVAGLGVRWSSTATTGYLWQGARTAALNEYGVGRWVNGVETYPVGTASTVAPALGDQLRVEVESSVGSTSVQIRGYVNDLLILTVNDVSTARIETGTRGAMRGHRAGTAAANGVHFDNFMFGDISTGAIPRTPSFLLLGVGV